MTNRKVNKTKLRHIPSSIRSRNFMATPAPNVVILIIGHDFSTISISVFFFFFCFLLLFASIVILCHFFFRPLLTDLLRFDEEEARFEICRRDFSYNRRRSSFVVARFAFATTTIEFGRRLTSGEVVVVLLAVVDTDVKVVGRSAAALVTTDE